MGIYVDYTLHFEGEEEELLLKLTRVRHRIQTLPIESTSDVIRVQPVVSPQVLRIIDTLKLPIPPVVANCLQPLRDHRDLLTHCIELNSVFGFDAPKDLEARWVQPGRSLMDRTDLWNPADYPKWVRDGHFLSLEFVTEGLDVDELPREPAFYGFTADRKCIFALFAQAMLSVGYILYIDPGEGSETVNLGLSTLTREGPGIWLGKSFTKTQYARQLQRAHSTVVAIVDLLQEEGLLLSAKDNSGYYQNRNWGRARRRIAAELAFAGVVSGSFGSLAQGALDLPEGTRMETVEDNAGSAFDRLRDMGATLEEVATGLAELGDQTADLTGEDSPSEFGPPL